MIEEPVEIKIEVNPSKKPRIRPVVAFPGDKVSFSSENGKSTFFFPEDGQIFEGEDVLTFTVGAEPHIRNIRPVENLPFKDTIGQRDTLFVEYAVHCTKDGETYFAEGNSAPIIIIPRFP